MPMSLQQWLTLFLLAGIWGSSFLFVELILRDLSPLSLVFLRLALAAPAVWVMLWLARQRAPRGWRIWLTLGLLAITNNILPFLLIAWAQLTITSGQASIFNALTPVSTALLAALVFRDEPLTAAKLVGAGLGVLGVALLAGFESQPHQPVGAALPAQLAAIGATCCYGVGNVYGRKVIGRTLHPLAAAAGQITLAAALLAPVAITFGHWDTAPWPGLSTWASLLTLSLAGTALAYGIYFHLLTSAGATNVSLVTLLVPAMALVLGAGLLDERVTLIQLGGFGTIAAGLLVVDGRVLRRLGLMERNVTL